MKIEKNKIGKGREGKGGAWEDKVKLQKEKKNEKWVKKKIIARIFANILNLKKRKI